MHIAMLAKTYSATAKNSHVKTVTNDQH